MASPSIGDISPFLQIIPTEAEEATFADFIVQGVDIFLHDGDSDYFTEYKKSLGKLLTFPLVALKSPNDSFTLNKFLQCLINLENYPSCILCKHSDKYMGHQPETIHRELKDILDDITDENSKRFFKFSDTAYRLAQLRNRIADLLEKYKAMEDAPCQEIS